MKEMVALNRFSLSGAWGRIYPRWGILLQVLPYSRCGCCARHHGKENSTAEAFSSQQTRPASSPAKTFQNISIKGGGKFAEQLRWHFHWTATPLPSTPLFIITYFQYYIIANFAEHFN